MYISKKENENEVNVGWGVLACGFSLVGYSDILDIPVARKENSSFPASPGVGDHTDPKHLL